MTIDEFADARQGLQRVVPQQVMAALSDGAVLVDIRSDAQRAADGLLPDAVYVPRNVLEWRADPKSSHPEPALGGLETRLILMCHEGYQSSLAAAMLQLLGRDATDVIGGCVSWRAAGLPVIESSAASALSFRVGQVSGYAIRRLDDVPDAFGGQYPGALRFLTDHLGAEQLAFTHRLMPPKSGGKGGYGHRHKTQEEIYFVISGTLQFKLDDDVVDVDGRCAVRVAPNVVRSIWNDGPVDAELVICSVRLDDPRADSEIVDDFWAD